MKEREREREVKENVEEEIREEEGRIENKKRLVLGSYITSLVQPKLRIAIQNSAFSSLKCSLKCELVVHDPNC